MALAIAACAADAPATSTVTTIDRCDWPMWGYDASRSFSYPCPTPISPDTVGDLRQVWFFNTEDAVTATPAVVDDTVYVGDWSGRFYAIDLATGRLDWSFDIEPHPTVYAGQIVASPAVADAGDVRTVYVAGGKTVYALRAADGELLWEHELGRPGDGSDPTEIESSPVVADGLVIFGTDVHNSLGGEPAGVVALDAATGRRRWFATTAPSRGGDPTGPGCGDVWGSPTVDLERRLVFVGTGNCTSEDGWGDTSEALLALDLDNGRRMWSFQPHEPNHDDLDFAGAPNLFEVDGRAAVGLGNKDAVYYAVDRETGELIWRRQVAEPGVPEPGSNFSTGGFIGPSAVSDGLVVGGTAVGGDPYIHAVDSQSGTIRWQQPIAGPTYAASLVANGVLFVGGIDYTFRAFDLHSGEVLWEEALSGAVSGGAVVVGDDVVVVAGMREPGVGDPIETAGVYRFSLDTEKPPTSGSPGSATSTTTASEEPTGTRLTPGTPESSTAPPGSSSTDPRAATQACIAAPCELSFDLTSDRVDGDVGRGTVHVSLDPFELTVETDGLGDPTRWLRPGSTAARAGATAYGVYLSEGTDNPVGGLVCVLDRDGDCRGTDNPAPGARYDRLSILAVEDADTMPGISDGFDRLVTTNSFAVPFTPAG